mgnify:CR=1 FL=1
MRKYDFDAYPNCSRRFGNAGFETLFVREHVVCKAYSIKSQRNRLCVKISIENGYVVANGKNLIGNKIHFPKISVVATGNVVMAAIVAKGTTTITNAASEPEIQQLCEILNQMGANISGIGSNTLVIEAGINDSFSIIAYENGVASTGNENNLTVTIPAGVYSTEYLLSLIHI